jgi:signal peptidase I
VVFIYPEDRSKDFIKRLIGLPGDTIEIRNKQIFVNGQSTATPTG